ncbi:MAG: DMT family transporter [Candidatus Aenigmarchaeota archaeon]|nr:DMT family transporter [Candidatus Aenigmarchaeota archaeon]
MMFMEWYIFAIMAAVLSGLVPSINKKILNNMPALEFSTFFSLINAILVLPIAFMVSFDIPLKILALLFAGSFFGVMGFLYVSKALKIFPVSVVSPLTNINPAVLLILAVFILGEKPTITQVIGITTIIIGAYIIESKRHPCEILSSIKIEKTSVLYITFLSATFYAFSSVIDKTVLKAITPLQYILIAHLFIASIFSFIVLAKTPDLKKLEPDFKKSFRWILLASVMTVAYRLMQAQAVSMTFVSLVIPIKHMNSLISTAVGGTLFHEKDLGKKMFACAIMLIGAYLVIA